MLPKVVFYLRLAGQTGRNRLQGAFRFLKDNRRNWDIRLPQTEQQFRLEVAANDIDGLIVSTATDGAVIRWAERFKKPVVFIDVPESKRTLVRPSDITVRNDDGGFGLLAAKHFLSLGSFASFGYVGAIGNPFWDLRREKGFLTGLARRGHPATVFRNGNPTELVRWLKDLPKPTAIYAAWDERARDVVQACRKARLSIPDKVVLLGTDDDELICTLSSPEISSLHNNTEGAGYLAAKWLDWLFRHTAPTGRRTILCRARGIVDRDSTRPPPPGRRLVEDALAYLKREHGPDVTPERVAEHLRCSRRILDLRFAEYANETLGGALTRIRLAHVRQLLTLTRRPIAEIGPLCGFSNPNALKNLFKRTFGHTMRDERNFGRFHGGP